MKLLVVAVGTRMPDWIDRGVCEFAQRMPRELPLQLVEIKPEARTGNRNAAALMAAERARIAAALPARSRLIALDEKGSDLTSRQLADRLREWMKEGRDVALVIGGPDGLAPELKAAADETLRLSSLTLPHALARVLLVEQLYRAASIVKGHPYHRQ